MNTILVTLPFSLRLNPETPEREFAKGEHSVSDAELAHWFMEGCRKEGRFTELAEQKAPGDELTGMDRPALLDMATSLDLGLPGNISNAKLLEAVRAAVAAKQGGEE